MRPKAIILDFDGVVVDSLPVHLAAWSAAVQAVFGRPLADPATLKGHATRTIAHMLCRRVGDVGQVGALIHAKESFIQENLDRIELLPGTRAFITLLAACGLPHGIASNSPRPFVTSLLARTGLVVPALVTGSDVSRGKPQPDIFWECANRLGLTPHDRSAVAVFEDSVHGLAAAQAAGMIPIGVATEQTPAVLLSAGARLACANLGEALAAGWIENLPL